MTSYQFSQDEFDAAQANPEASLTRSGRQKRNSAFRLALRQHIERGGNCPDVTRVSLASSCLGTFPTNLQERACPHLFSPTPPPSAAPTPAPPALTPGATGDIPTSALKNGHCYAALLRPHARGAAIAALGDNVSGERLYPYLRQHASEWSSEHFTFILGTKYGTGRNLKFFCHVQEAAAGHSMLRTRDIFDSVPIKFVFGAADDVVVPAVAPAARLPQPADYLGTITPANERRFADSIGTITTSEFAKVKGVATSDHTGRTGTYNPLNAGEALTWISFFSAVSYRDLRVTLRPKRFAAHYYVDLHEAWIPATETAPTSDAKFAKFPSHNARSLYGSPFAPAGPITIECGFGYGVERIVKPTPVFGGSPRFAYLSWDSLISKADDAPFDAAGLDLYDVFVEFVLIAQIGRAHV